MSEKVKIQLEYVLNCSPKVLYNWISTASGLGEWFADNVNSRGEVFTFIWNDAEEKARLLSKKTGERIKFRWLEDEEDEVNYFFELRIQVDEITKDVSLIVTDFIDEDEIEEAKMLWDNQISDLKQVLGSA